MSEKPSYLPSNSGKTEIPKPAKPRAASKGKRLFALLLDFILALLLMNTLDQFFRSEDWDLKMQTPGVEKMLIFYGGIIFFDGDSGSLGKQSWEDFDGDQSQEF